MADYIDKWQAAANLMDAHLKDTAKAVDAIQYMDVADVRPVVRGKWVGNKRHQSCSECHMTYCVPDGQDGELDMTAYHFCPNCGADMRQEGVT